MKRLFLILILLIPLVCAIPKQEVHQFDPYLRLINENEFAVDFLRNFGYSCINVKVESYEYDIQIIDGRLTIVTNSNYCKRVAEIKSNEDLLEIKQTYYQKKYLGWNDINKVKIPLLIKLKASYIIFKMLYL